jgi:hypothetical protein
LCQVTDYDPAAPPPSPRARGFATKPADKPVVVLCYLGDGQRSGAAAVEAAALLAAGRGPTVVLVVRDVSAASLARAEPHSAVSAAEVRRRWRVKRSCVQCCCQLLLLRCSCCCYVAL